MADLRRSSSRLATKRSLNEQCGASASSNGINSTASTPIHRPEPGQSPTRNDCGILPGEWYYIQSSSDPPHVPHGYICGYPLRRNNGDMYGGNHYISSADTTAQGRAIVDAAVKFGDGRTLCFTPCKRYYNPYSINDKKDGTKMRMYGCRLHHELRERRVKKEGWRVGEKRLSDFWSGDGLHEDDDEEDGSERSTKRLKAK